MGIVDYALALVVVSGKELRLLPREFVETRTKRYMAQALAEFELRIEQPLVRLSERDDAIPPIQVESVVLDIERVKQLFRAKLQALAEDCLDLMSSDLQINGYEPVLRR